MRSYGHWNAEISVDGRYFRMGGQRKHRHRLQTGAPVKFEFAPRKIKNIGADIKDYTELPFLTPLCRNGGSLRRKFGWTVAPSARTLPPPLAEVENERGAGFVAMILPADGAAVGRDLVVRRGPRVAEIEFKSSMEGI